MARFLESLRIAIVANVIGFLALPIAAMLHTLLGLTPNIP